MSADAGRAEEYVRGVLAGERRTVARTITLLESRRPDHVELGQRILEALVPRSGRAVRVGITGPPGVGKSSFIETLGLRLVEAGQRTAVLAVDPTSPLSGGSILGDKTRMVQLAQSPAAFIRPSPSGGTLGGVAHRTREAIVVVEAAGFDVVLVETVGVGQSEAEVHSMVDFFCVLLQPGAGDELQGIKRGVLELADALVVNKADGEQAAAAERTRADYSRALELLRPPSEHWKPRVLAASARTGAGIDDFWKLVREHRELLERTGELERRRRAQARVWLRRLLEEALLADFRADPELARRLEAGEKRIEGRETTPPRLVRELLEAYRARRDGTA